MSNDQHSHRPGHRRRRWWHSWLSRLSQKLTSRKLNIYQVVLVAIVSYLVFRVISVLILDNLDMPPEPGDGSSLPAAVLGVGFSRTVGRSG
jgi:hypothetical protein